MEHLGKTTDKVSASPSGTGLDGLDPILRTCGEVAAVRLAGGLSDALGQAIRQLGLQGLQSPHHEDYLEMADAAAFARACRYALVRDFGAELERRYVRACVRRPSPLEGYLIDFDVSQLRIVVHDRLDDSLAPGRLAEAIRSACWEPLCQLAAGFARQLGMASMNPLEIPLSPKIIELALAEAMRGQPWRHESKELLLRALCAGLPKAVHGLYLDLLPLLGQAVPAPPDAVQDTLEAAAEDGDIPAAVSRTEDRASPPASPVAEEARAEPPAVAGTSADSPPPAEESAVPAGEAGLAPPLLDPARALPAGEAPWQPLFARLGRLQDQARQSARLVAERLRAPIVVPWTADPPMPGPLPLDPIPAPAPPVATKPEADRITGVPRPPPHACPQDLMVGSWLDLREPDGRHRELKLAWISPRRNLYLFTNRDGERALSLDVDALEDLLRDGRARIIPAPGEPGAEPGGVQTPDTRKRA